jgi:hypothetical protein
MRGRVKRVDWAHRVRWIRRHPGAGTATAGKSGSAAAAPVS